MTTTQPRLFSYCIPIDDGAAPNPYWGICTLAICKPRIRSQARIGDWVAGVGAKHAKTGDRSAADFSGKLVYAMRVTKVLAMRDYDAWTRSYCPNKVPNWTDADARRRLGDSIYDFSTAEPRLRESVHLPENRGTDLQGHNVLMSDHFFYFGSAAVQLPDELKRLAHQQEGHRSNANAAYFDTFVAWIQGLGHAPGSLLGSPIYNVFAGQDQEAAKSACARFRKAEDETELASPERGVADFERNGVTRDKKPKC